MAAYFSTLVFFAIGGLLQPTSAACVDRSLDDSYGFVPLPTGQFMWYCANESTTFANNARAHISSCRTQGFLENDALCQASTVDNGACDSADAILPPEATEQTDLGLPDYLKYYSCNDGFAWLSSYGSRYSSCLLGDWSPILDVCAEECAIECSYPRDCSMIAEMGFNQSDVFNVIPSGDQNDDIIQVYCLLGDDPDYHGWTLIAKSLGVLTLTADGNAALVPVGPDTEGPYFIGLQHFADLTWSRKGTFPIEKRPQIMKIVGRTSASDLLHATYNNTVIDPSPDYTLISADSFHGNGGDALKYSIGQSFDTAGLAWWSSDDSTLGFNMNGPLKWAVEGSAAKDLQYAYVLIRPQEFDEAIACPPKIEYDSAWVDSTEVDFNDTRAEGSVISYHCVKDMFMESSQNVEGIVTCVRTGDVLDWDYVPNFPCELVCPDNYEVSVGGESCLRFSENVTLFGITSAAQECAMEGASLAMMEHVEDFNLTTVAGRTYYTAHTLHDTVVVPDQPADTDFTCDPAICTPAATTECLAFERTEEDVFSQKPQNCYNESYYVCQLPDRCPPGFSAHEGFCYQLTADFSPTNSFAAALQKCKTMGSALAYPLWPDTLLYFKKLVWEQEQVDPLSSEVNVLIGLNDWYEDWSSGFDYFPTPEMIDEAGTTVDGQHYRYITIGVNRNDTVTISPADYEVDDSVTINYAMCQLHGPIECFYDPPLPNENMTLTWDETHTLGNVATYECLPGYFMNYNLSLTKQEFQCRGQLGGWVPVESEAYNCTLMDVCDPDELPCMESLFCLVEASTDFLTLNSSVRFTCPSGMTMPDGSTDVNVTCVQNPGTDPATYGFSPPSIDQCKRCGENVTASNATTDWDENTNYVIGDNITITCDEGLLMNIAGEIVNETVIQCTEIGWWENPESFECLPACMDPLIVPGENMTVGNITDPFVGGIVTYTCDEGTYIPSAFPDKQVAANITCGPDGQWTSGSLNETDLYCTEMCFEDPVTPPEPANSTWDQVSRFGGDEVNITCPEGYAFPDFTNVTTITCEPGGQWTDVSTMNITCRRYTIYEPMAPNNSNYSHPEGPYWEGTVLNFSCPENYLSPTGVNTSSITFNGTEWVPDDPEFECKQICTEPPMEAEEPVFLNFTGGVAMEGDVAVYECPGGFEGTDDVNMTSVCKDGNWTVHDIPYCKMCKEPVPPPAYVTLYVNQSFVYGSKAYYKCNGIFEDDTIVAESTCDAGNWTLQKFPWCFPCKL